MAQGTRWMPANASTVAMHSMCVVRSPPPASLTASGGGQECPIPSISWVSAKGQEREYLRREDRALGTGVGAYGPLCRALAHDNVGLACAQNAFHIRVRMPSEALLLCDPILAPFPN